MLYRFDRVNKSYGPKVVLREATWQHNPGEKVGLIGRNGAGKTTLLRIALGREEPDSGELIKANAVRIATVDQALPSDLEEKLRKDKPGVYEAAIQPVPDPAGWFHVRVEVTKQEVSVSIEGSTRPCLVVDRLGHRAGDVGLWVDSMPGDFRNLRIQPAR